MAMKQGLSCKKYKTKYEPLKLNIYQGLGDIVWELILNM